MTFTDAGADNPSLCSRDAGQLAPLTLKYPLIPPSALFSSSLWSLSFSLSLSLSLSLLMSLSLLFGLVFAYYLFASFVIVLSVSVYLYLPHLPLFLSLALNHTRHQEGQTDGCGLTQGRSPSPHSTGCKGDLHLKLTLKRKKIKFCYGHEE